MTRQKQRSGCNSSKDAVPHAEKVAVLTDPDLPYRQVEGQQLELAAHFLRLMLRRYALRHASELESTFVAIGRDHPAAPFLTASSLNFVQRRRILELSGANRLPTMAVFREYPEAGGLMSYGSIRTDRFRRAAIYVGRILKGAKPADLAVEQPTKYELVINLRTARALNLELPRALLDVADSGPG